MRHARAVRANEPRGPDRAKRCVLQEPLLSLRFGRRLRARRRCRGAEGPPALRERGRYACAVRSTRTRRAATAGLPMIALAARVLAAGSTGEDTRLAALADAPQPPRARSSNARPRRRRVANT